MVAIYKHKQQEEDPQVIQGKSIPTLKKKVKPTLNLRNFNIKREVQQQKANVIAFFYNGNVFLNIFNSFSFK